MTKEEALTLALEALELLCVKCRSNEWGPDTPRKEILNWMHDHASKAHTSIEEALAQLEHDSLKARKSFYLQLDRRVERIRKGMEIKTVTMRCKDYDIALPIIEAHLGHVFVGQVFKPPQRQWVGLTDEDITEIDQGLYPTWKDEVQAIEARLKELNNG